MSKQNFYDQYQQRWPSPTEIELAIYELARTYYLETEAFDRQICTGPIVRNEIQPASHSERRVISLYAAGMLKNLQHKALALSCEGVAMLREAMRSHDHSGQIERDLRARFGHSSSPAITR